jgi:hypothetical protein
VKNRPVSIDTSSLSGLAAAWWALVQSECPGDWCNLLPEISFNSPDRFLEPKTLSVLSFLPGLAANAPVSYRAVIDRLIDAQKELYFGQTYSSGDFGKGFLSQYGWIKLLGPDAYWNSGDLSSGFLILGDNITYPPHRHEAEEIYLPISGNAHWYREDQGWQLRPAGTLIHHASGIQHATRTQGEPLIALYLWRGGNLTQKSEIG